MNKIIPFLQELTQNNNREWFNNNKETYKDALQDFKTLITQLIQNVGIFDNNIAELTPQNTVFRIYRDVRFSNNKQPYKTHFGAYMAKKGRKSQYAGYYLHIEPDNSFISAGLYRPDATSLKKVREQIDYNAIELRNILNQPDFKQYYGKLQGEKLKTSPRNYSPDHQDIDLLRHKEYVALMHFNEQNIEHADFISFCTTRFYVLKPLIDYLNNAIDYIDEEPHITF